MDSRYEKLARSILGYSVALKKGESILFDLVDTPDELAIAFVREARRRRAIPFVDIRRSKVSRAILNEIDQEQARLTREIELHRMKRMQAYVAVRGSENSSEFADVPSSRMGLFTREIRSVLNYRVNKTRWCVLRWPTSSFAQAAGMSTEAFEDFYFRVCTMDYRRFAKAMKPLERLMAKTDRVEIKGPGTDLSFSIKGIGARMCRGDRNVPDGEVFSCPLKTSVNGTIQYNTPTLYAGTRFENVCLQFEQGKIVNATANDTRRLNQILDTDPGARFVGEFSLGLNPHILNPMCDILFDEKITGSLHFTPGQAYEDCGNGNKSAVHWDMVLIQRPEWGGGEVWFDGKLIRKNGRFVVPSLEGLNRDRLLAAESPS